MHLTFDLKANCPRRNDYCTDGVACTEHLSYLLASTSRFSASLKLMTLQMALRYCKNPSQPQLLRIEESERLHQP